MISIRTQTYQGNRDIKNNYYAASESQIICMVKTPSKFIKNKEMENFKNTYGLKDADSKLNVSMYIELNSYGNNNIEEVNKKAVVSLSMPLTKRTTGIDLNNELVLIT